MPDFSVHTNDFFYSTAFKEQLYYRPRDEEQSSFFVFIPARRFGTSARLRALIEQYTGHTNQHDEQH